jgi:hypothetical protein
MTHTVKTLTVGNTTLELPAAMPSKDIQQLAGALATLRLVDSHGLWATEYRTVFYVHTNGPTIMLGEQEVHTKHEADELQAADRLAREAKEKAERAMG